ncbi:MAG: hypothetical protein E7545_05645 [Ruminococcaceae bacterium]|nr:hypothetical protein [Oscillospiraceae bacterium]
MKEYFKIKFTSEEWMKVDEENSSQIFYDLGFRTLDEVLNIRMFDLFNLQDVNNNRAEEFFVTVFKFLYPDKTIDYNIYYDSNKEKTFYIKWKEKHPLDIDVLVKDVLIQEEFEVGTMLCIYDYVTQAFYRSSEYDNRKYRYMNYSNLKNKNSSTKNTNNIKTLK